MVYEEEEVIKYDNENISDFESDSVDSSEVVISSEEIILEDISSEESSSEEVIFEESEEDPEQEDFFLVPDVSSYMLSDGSPSPEVLTDTLYLEHITKNLQVTNCFLAIFSIVVLFILLIKGFNRLFSLDLL